jgi:glycosyltransferase involved in cell wall biosynthesis
MKILLVNYEYTLTGATLLLLRLAEHWRNSGHDIAVTAAVPTPGPIKLAYEQRGFAVLDQTAVGTFDVAMCNTVLTAPQLLALSDAMKTIWFIHEGSIGLDYLLRNSSHIAAFGRASAVVFPVEHLRDAIYRSFTYALDQSRFAIIPYGIPAIVPPPARDPASGEFRVVSVGSIYPRKRHEDLIRAMARYQGPAARCILVGKFHSLPDDRLQFIAANPQKIELAGEVEHDAATALLGSADMFCLPSASEVLPLTTLEAAMLEKPMVLSDLAVYKGIWRHGHNCLLYPVGAIGMLAQSIAMLAGNPELRARLGAAARYTASRYTERAFCARFDALLDVL